MILSGTWTDVTRSGRIVRSVGASVLWDVGSVAAPDELLFLRADEGPRGLVIVGKAHHGNNAWLWLNGTWTDLGDAPGNHPVETDGTRIYVMRSGTAYDVIDLTVGGTSYRASCALTSQGFCDCTSPFSLMSDDVRAAVPHIYRPQWAGGWWVGQARESYAALAVQGDVPWWLEDDVRAVEEVRAVRVGDEIVACAYTPTGVWAWRGQPTAIPVEGPPTESPVGARVDGLWGFLTGAAPQGWSRTGTHQMDCHRAGQSAYFVKFGDPRAWEHWARQGDTIYHVEDHSGTARGGESYQWSDGTWLRQSMTVGQRLDVPDNAIRWYRDGAWQAWAPWPMAVTLDAHRRYSTGVEEIDFSYHYGPWLSVREVYQARTDAGWWSWTLHQDGTTQRVTWPTVRDAAPLAPQGQRVPWPDARPIVIETEPEEPDMPGIAFPPRNETYDFVQQLDAYYRDALQRPLADPHYVDLEGEAVWMQEYLRLRVNGASHDAAVADVKRQIDAVVNPPENPR